MLYRVIIIGMLILIGYNLFSALYHMMKGNKNDTRMIKSLTWRIALSIGLFTLLMLGLYTGIIVRSPG
jgi:hypothetical protein